MIATDPPLANEILLTAFSVRKLRLALPVEVVAGVYRKPSGQLVLLSVWGDRRWEFTVDEYPQTTAISLDRYRPVPTMVQMLVPWLLDGIVIDPDGPFILVPAFPFERPERRADSGRIDELLADLRVGRDDLVIRIGELGPREEVVIPLRNILSVEPAPIVQPLAGASTGLILWRGDPVPATSLSRLGRGRRCTVLELRDGERIGMISEVAGPIERIPVQAERVEPPPGAGSRSGWRLGNRTWWDIDLGFLASPTLASPTLASPTT